MDWVTRLLGLTPGGPLNWVGDPAFSVRVATALRNLSTCCDPSSRRATERG